MTVAQTLPYLGSPSRPVIADHVRVFNEPDGKAIAVDRRAIGIVRQGENGATIVSFKLSQQRPISIKANFADVYRWWTSDPAPNPEMADAAER